jgi:hypothetical protein
VSGHEASAQQHLTEEFLERGPLILVKMVRMIDQRNW